MKKPTKAELNDQISYLTNQLLEMNRQKEKQKFEKWMKRYPDALEFFHKNINRKLFGDTICNLTFERVDNSGYWFTFELENDSRRQTYAVRHTDLNIIKCL